MLKRSQDILLDLIRAQGVAIVLDQVIVLGGQTPTKEQIRHLLNWLQTRETSEVFFTDFGLTISVESALGQGATFWFTASLESLQFQLTPALHSTVSDCTVVPSTTRILLVEDTPLNQKLMLQMLKRLGYEADAVSDGQQALDQLDTRTYNIVLMDCQMPVLDGYEATRQLRIQESQRSQQGQPHRTTVIGVTAYAMVGDQEKCLAAGMDDYLSKPIKLNDLKSLLERWL